MLIIELLFLCCNSNFLTGAKPREWGNDPIHNYFHHHPSNPHSAPVSVWWYPIIHHPFVDGFSHGNQPAIWVPPWRAREPPMWCFNPQLCPAASCSNSSINTEAALRRVSSCLILQATGAGTQGNHGTSMTNLIGRMCVCVYSVYCVCIFMIIYIYTH